MKVAFLSIMDNGNWCRHMARGLRDYCGVDATSYAYQPDTYVNIPDATVEYLQVPKGAPIPIPDADLYITNDHTYYQFVERLPPPVIVKCNGTFARKNGAFFHDLQRQGIIRLTHTTQPPPLLPITGPCDYTLARALGFSIQTLGPVYDHRLLPTPDFPDDAIIVGHAPTGPSKGTDYILKQLQPYRRNNQITIDFIRNLPWQECIPRKARCAIFIDQYNTWGAFGINAIESLALGSIVLNSPLHPYVKQYFPNIPLYAFPQDLEAAISDAGKTYVAYTEWAKTHFDISTQAPHLMEWITWMTTHSNTS